MSETNPTHTSETESSWFALTALRELRDIPSERLALPPEMKHVSVPVLKLVAMILLTYAQQGTGGGARPTIATIAEKCCICERTARRALRALEYLGVIKKQFAEGQRRGRSYTLLVGRQQLPQVNHGSPADTKQITLVRDAYFGALQQRHMTRFHKPVSVALWRRYVAPIQELADDTGLSFGDCADHVMREFMTETGMSDGKLVELCHPPGWLANYLAAITSELRRKLLAPETEPVDHYRGEPLRPQVAAALAALRASG